MSARAIVVAMFAVAALLAWMFRYEITSVETNMRGGGAYVLDRWTGGLTFVAGTERYAVKENGE
jgi:hypothetical protein